MAEVDTIQLSQEHADIRRESAVYAGEIKFNTADQVSNVRREGSEHTNDIIKEGIKGDFVTTNAVKDARYDVLSTVHGGVADLNAQLTAHNTAMTDRFFTVARESADNKAQITALGYQVRDGFFAAGKDSEINALKGQIELAKQSTYLSDKIDADGEKTRGLINDLKYNDLSRHLVERNAELVESKFDNRHLQHAVSQGQWSALNSQLQAFQSQLQETRQGVNNFGTMSGSAGQQTSTSNNVR